MEKARGLVGVEVDWMRMEELEDKRESLEESLGKIRRRLKKDSEES